MQHKQLVFKLRKNYETNAFIYSLKRKFRITMVWKGRSKMGRKSLIKWLGCSETRRVDSSKEDNLI